jgi:hypothetical protein
LVVGLVIALLFIVCAFVFIIQRRRGNRASGATLAGSTALTSVAPTGGAEGQARRSGVSRRSSSHRVLRGGGGGGGGGGVAYNAVPSRPAAAMAAYDTTTVTSYSAVPSRPAGDLARYGATPGATLDNLYGPVGGTHEYEGLQLGPTTTTTTGYTPLPSSRIG